MKKNKSFDLPVKKNDIIELEISGMTNEGNGVGRYENIAVFVPFTAIGDKIKCKIVKLEKSFCYGIIESFINESVDRIASDCEVYSKCGGCAFRHITYESESKIKGTFVKDAFSRIGKIDFEFDDILNAENTCFYRNKCQYPVCDENGVAIAGFYSKRSHRIVPYIDCKLQPEIFRNIVKDIIDFQNKNKIKAYNELDNSGLLRHIFIRKGYYTNEIMVGLVVTKNCHLEYKPLSDELMSKYNEIKSVMLNINSDNTNVILGKKTLLLAGREYIEDIMCKKRIKLSLQSFYQVNTHQAEKLYSIAAEYAQLSGNETLIDLYCGAGTIGLSMSDKVKKLIGVEVVSQAVDNAKENAKLNNVLNAEFICADAGQAALMLENNNTKPDVVILDPPRKGCDLQTIESVCAMNPDRIVMISCNPATAARDAKIFAEKGYYIKKGRAVDLFPRTTHVECVTLLSRKIDVHAMKLDSAPFEMIKRGVKTIELRLFDEKRQQIKTGDMIVFTNNSNGDTLHSTVAKLHRFDSFEELYKSLPLLKCGYTIDDIDNAKPSDMEQYYSNEDQEKYGVVGIELC